MDSSFSWYSPGFYHFSVLAWIVFQYSHRLYLFPVLARILPFFVTHTYSTLFRYSPGQFFDTRTDSTFFGTRTDTTFSRYSLGFDHFSVPSLIQPFSGILPDSCSILARILPFFVTHTNSTLFGYSPELFFNTHRNSTFSRYSHGF